MGSTVGTIDAAAEPAELIAAAAGGDMAAFERLYRQFSPRVYGLCLRLTGQREAAEDCTQEAFVAAWRALPGFEGRSRFSSWLHRIAVHTVLARRAWRSFAARMKTSARRWQAIRPALCSNSCGKAPGTMNLTCTTMSYGLPNPR